MAQLLTYSFSDVQASITGPGGTFSLAAGAGDANEGISIEYDEDATTVTTGADGGGMHTLNPTRSGSFMVRCLKTSPTNAKLSAMYNFQRTSSANWGQNSISVNVNTSGDQYSIVQAAFAKFPSNSYAKDANVIEWHFKAVRIDASLGGLTS